MRHKNLLTIFYFKTYAYIVSEVKFIIWEMEKLQAWVVCYFKILKTYSLWSVNNEFDYSRYWIPYRYNDVDGCIVISSLSTSKSVPWKTALEVLVWKLSFFRIQAKRILILGKTSFLILNNSGYWNKFLSRFLC